MVQMYAEYPGATEWPVDDETCEYLDAPENVCGDEAVAVVEVTPELQLYACAVHVGCVDDEDVTITFFDVQCNHCGNPPDYCPGEHDECGYRQGAEWCAVCDDDYGEPQPHVDSFGRTWYGPAEEG